MTHNMITTLPSPSSAVAATAYHIATLLFENLRVKCFSILMRFLWSVCALAKSDGNQVAGKITMCTQNKQTNTHTIAVFIRPTIAKPNTTFNNWIENSFFLLVVFFLSCKQRLRGNCCENCNVKMFVFIIEAIQCFFFLCERIDAARDWRLLKLDLVLSYRIHSLSSFINE